MQVLYQKHMHIFRLCRKHVQSFEKDWYKTVWGVVLTRYPLSIQDEKRLNMEKVTKMI